MDTETRLTSLQSKYSYQGVDGPGSYKDEVAIPGLDSEFPEPVSSECPFHYTTSQEYKSNGSGCKSKGTFKMQGSQEITRFLFCLNQQGSNLKTPLLLGWAGKSKQ